VFANQTAHLEARRPRFGAARRRARDTYRRRYEMNSFNVQLITGIRANMKNMLLPLLDKLLLRRRVIVR
jgi:hypothetical protein